jgi:hypothetical protein
LVGRRQPDAAAEAGTAGPVTTSAATAAPSKVSTPPPTVTMPPVGFQQPDALHRDVSAPTPDAPLATATEGDKANGGSEEGQEGSGGEIGSLMKF